MKQKELRRINFMAEEIKKLGSGRRMIIDLTEKESAQKEKGLTGEGTV
jgi:hypothetical protein